MSKWFPLMVLLIVPLSCASAEKPTAHATDTTGKSASPSPAADQNHPTPPPDVSATATPDVTPASAAAPVAPPNESAVPPKETKEAKVIHFPWCRKKKVASSYEMAERENQHRIIIPPQVKPGTKVPVVLAFHGQPKRGKAPSEYPFLKDVSKQVLQMVATEEIGPVILVMPVFRFMGGNWPWFHAGQFRQMVEEMLAEQGYETSDWYAFGHSGAAGCGGQGLNQIHLANPKGVGFFDTCLGVTWQEEIRQLQKRGVPTVNIHSVETAGFRPRQFPEYQATFDFGRAYGPLKIDPIPCPEIHPGQSLRTLEHRCAATDDGVISAFVIDTGVGAIAHKRILTPAIHYFLKEFAGL